MAPSGMLHRVALVRTNVSEELSASIIRVTRIDELVVTANVHSSPTLVTLMMEALSSSETSVSTTATQRNIPEDAILHCYCNFIDYHGVVTFSSCFCLHPIRSERSSVLRLLAVFFDPEMEVTCQVECRGMLGVKCRITFAKLR
jgi:hypothetical protein